MSEIILLGAGSSIKAGIPDSYGLTDLIVEKLQENPWYAEHVRIAKFVIGGLLFQKGIKGDNPLNSGINVEEFFSAVQLLSERNILEAAPFIGSWHSMVEEFDTINPSLIRLDKLHFALFDSVRNAILGAFSNRLPRMQCRSIGNIRTTDDISDIINGHLARVVNVWLSTLKSSYPKGRVNLSKEFQKAVSQTQSQPGEGRIFKDTAYIMILTLKEIAWIKSPQNVTYFNPLLNLLKKRNRVVVATLNYDNALELAAKTMRINCNTGIEHWSKTGIFDIDDEGLHLLKLHGSIDWKWRKNIRSNDRLLPHSIIERISSNEMESGNFHPAIIFGKRNKLTTEGPFLDLLRSFHHELSLAETLTTIGYSFRDDHINTYISQWLNHNQNHCIRIIDPYFDKSKVEYVQHLKKLRDKRPKQIQIIIKPTEIGLIDLYGG